MEKQEELVQLFTTYPLFFFAFISKYYPLSEHQLDILVDNLFWGLISLNEEIEFNIPLIEKYIKKLNREDLRYNKQVNENKEILKHFNLKPRSYWQKIDCDEVDSESDQNIAQYHPSVRYHEYSLVEIEKNKNNIQWNHFSSNELLDWNYDLILKYKDYLWFGIQEDPDTYTTDGLELYNNESVPWNVKLIELFAEKVLTHKEVVKQFMFNKTMVKNIKSLIEEELLTSVLSELNFRHTITIVH